MVLLKGLSYLILLFQLTWTKSRKSSGNKLEGDVGDSLSTGSNVSLFSAEGEV